MPTFPKVLKKITAKPRGVPKATHKDSTPQPSHQHTLCHPQTLDTTSLSLSPCLDCHTPFSPNWQPTDIYTCTASECSAWVCAACFRKLQMQQHECVPSDEFEGRGGGIFIIFEAEKAEQCGRCDKVLRRERPVVVMKCRVCASWVCEACCDSGRGATVLKIPREKTRWERMLGKITGVDDDDDDDDDDE